MVLGIDPGIGRTGFAFVKPGYPSAALCDYGIIKTASKDSLSRRLVDLRKSCGELVKGKNIVAVAVEKLFFNQNKTTGIIVAMARGVILEIFEEYGIDLYEYAPTQVKKAVTGSGRAQKKDVQIMAGRLLGLSGPLVQDDAADAAALALCHLAALRVGDTGSLS